MTTTNTLVKMYSAMDILFDDSLIYPDDVDILNLALDTLGEISDNDPTTVEYLAYVFLEEVDKGNVKKADRIRRAVFNLMIDELEEED